MSQPAGATGQTRARPGWMRAVDALSGVCGAVAATMILVAVLLTCQMIWVRTVNNASTVWQTETVIYLMIGATLLGLPYVQRWRGHVNVDLLPRLLPPAAARGLAVLTLGVAILVIGVMLRYGYEMWHVAWERGWRSDTVWGPPLWIPYVALPIGFALYLVQLVSDLVAVATGVDAPFAPAHAPGERADAALELEAAPPGAARPGAAPPGVDRSGGGPIRGRAVRRRCARRAGARENLRAGTWILSRSAPSWRSPRSSCSSPACRSPRGS